MLLAFRLEPYSGWPTERKSQASKPFHHNAHEHGLMPSILGNCPATLIVTLAANYFWQPCLLLPSRVHTELHLANKKATQ